MLEEVFRADSVSLTVRGKELFQNISLHLFRGEILGVTGTFHSGVNELKQILLGTLLPATGSFYYLGKRANLFDRRLTPIGWIGRQSSLVEDMTVAENLYLLRRRNPFWVNWKSMNRYINNVLRAIGFGLRANSPVRDLSVVQRKIVEILKLAMLDIRVILIDSSICYTEKANAELYDAVRIFCQRGLSFIYFGNSPNCFLLRADRIMVFRSNHLAGYVTGAARSDAVLMRMMGVTVDAAEIHAEASDTDARALLYRLRVRAGSDIREIGIYENEILCFCSLETHFTNMLSNLFIKTSRQRFPAASAAIFDAHWNLERIRSGKIALLPYDYTGSVICGDLSVFDNVYLNYKARNPNNNLLSRLRKGNFYSRQLDNLFHKPKGWSMVSRSSTLSEQEQRKLLVYRCFIGSRKLLLITYPTKGTAQILAAAKQRRLSVVIITDSIHEAIDTCDKIFVVEKGRIVRVIQNDCRSSPNPYV